MSFFYGLLASYKPIAALFPGVNQYLSIASNSSIVLGGGADFEIDCWVKATPNGALQVVLWKGGGADATVEYALRLNTLASVVTFLMGNGTAVSSSLGSASFTPGNWTYIYAWYDSAITKTNVSVNDGAANSASFSGTPLAGSLALTIGGFASTQPFNGPIDGVSLWKRKRTAAERTWAYNLGHGRRFADMDSAYKTSMVARWELDEASGSRFDSQGSNTLTANGTGGVGSTTGIVGS